jgi:MarR family 2-MHQ and catechol resistance regulon transcriptional repressor
VECSLDDARLTLAGLFFEAHAGLTATLERHLETECGLSIQWFEVLLRLARSSEQRLRMQELVAQVTLTPSGLTRVVDRLEEAGLVRREACPSDRRGSYAVLTPKGKRTIEAAVPVHLVHLESSFTGLLTDVERTNLEAALRKLRDALHPCGEAARMQGDHSGTGAEIGTEVGAELAAER